MIYMFAINLSNKEDAKLDEYGKRENEVEKKLIDKIYDYYRITDISEIPQRHNLPVSYFELRKVVQKVMANNVEIIKGETPKSYQAALEHILGILETKRETKVFRNIEWVIRK